ncbi:MAG TPA: class II aldolase/adducin family protein [Spirochaetia bacterium]|nr:class II aldolase/adducin family protein [Spirochaetia bacterium]
MRRDLQAAKAQVEQAARRAYQRGIQTGNGGNISARVPGVPHMVVKPSGVSLIDCTPDTMIVTDFEGNVVEGKGRPTRESVLHGALYQGLPKVGGVVHTHSPWSIAWSFTGRDLPLVTLHTQLKLARAVPVRFFASPKGVLKEETPAVLDLFAAHPDLTAFIMGAHGIVAVGPDVLEAEHTAELVEETAQVAYLHELGAHAGILSLGPMAVANQDVAWIARESLVACGRKLAARGFVIGPEGSMSVRSGDSIWVLADGASPAEADPDDFVAVDVASGQPVGGGRQPSAHLPLHLAYYRARPDTRAVIHCYPPASMTAASVGMWAGESRTSRALSEEVAFVEGESPDPTTVEACARRSDALVLGGHGVLTAGGSLSQALARAERVERQASAVLFRRSSR